MEYPFERAVADGVNVGYDVFRIRTKIGEKGSTVEAGYEVDYRDKATRAVRWQQLEEALEYGGGELDRSVVSPSQMRTVIRAYKEKLETELFPEREHVPKTLIFAKNDAHAEDIVTIVREEFGKGNAFCRKITYRAEGDADELIKAFRTSYNPRVAVTVDMISTGTDIKPLEVLLFMRDVKSQTYFEQMVGRGSRTITATDLLAVTPDAATKTHFVLIDAVGVTESAKHTDVRPLERKRGVGFAKLLEMVAFGKRDTDTLTSLAGRLARLEQRLKTEDADRVLAEGGRSLQALTNGLLDAVDADKQAAKAAELGEGALTDEQLGEARKALAVAATKPFNQPGLRNLLTELHERSEQVIDTVSIDKVTYAGYDFDKARALVGNFRAFIEAHKDELLALQILYNQPYGQRRLTFEAVKELAEALQKPPYYIDSERLWGAYERLEKDRVRGAPAERLLTNIISLVRFALGQSELLEPYPEQLDRRFSAWLAQQEQAGRFGPEQVEWLVMIKEHLSTSLTIEPDDFSYAPFNQKGGRVRAAKLFGPELPGVLDELNRVLAA